MTDALEGHEGIDSIGSRTITSLRSADDIDGSAREEQELAKLVERLDKASTAYDMEISAENTKLMIKNTPAASTQRSKLMDRSLRQSQDLRTWAQLQPKRVPSQKILSRIAQTTAALTRLKSVWNDRSISLGSKIRLMRFPCHIHFSVCL